MRQTSSNLYFGLVILILSLISGTQADQAKPAAGADSGSSSSMLMGTLMRYLDPTNLASLAGNSGEQIQSKLLANWSPNDDTKKQQVLRSLISQASDLIENYQSNGLRNVPSLPINIPGVGSVMKTPDKLLRAELSMLQDLIKMSQKMIQNPISATMEVPKDLALLMSRMAFQVEQ